MQSLKDENDLLKLELHDRQKRVEELENIVLVFKNDQAKIEEGIINALNHLSAFEDTVYQAAASNANSISEQSSTSEAAEADLSAGEGNAVSEAENQSQAATVVSVTVTQPASGESANSNQMEIF